MTYLEFKVKLKNILKPRSEGYDEIIGNISDKITTYCEDNRDKYAACISTFKGSECRFIMSGDCIADDLKTEGCKLWRSFGIEGRIVKTAEVSSIRVNNEIRFVRDVDNHDEIQKLMKLEAMRNIDYEEDIIRPSGASALEKIARQRNISELKNEAKRIASAKQSKFIGHPVHYLYKGEKNDVADNVIDTLVGCLLKSNRLETGRIIYYESNWDSSVSDEMNHLYENITGGTIVFIIGGSNSRHGYADASERFIKAACKNAVKNQNRVLTIFVIGKADVKSENQINAFINGKISFVSFDEMLMDNKAATSYLYRIADERNVENKQSLKKLLKPDNKYSAGELDAIFDDYYSEYLRTDIFPAYADIKKPKKTEKKEEGAAADELAEMIGLESVKDVISKSVSFFKFQQMYKERNLPVENPARSMIFTGNPGTAKTTVARLAAKIFRDNNLLPNGKLIEVGRADIVGEYVGQTAPLVKEIFRKAKGSVLFIDEAYSLVDDRDGLYGDEAINTIVQEMENHRDDTIVIFAGYPDKMEQFMNKNPGLRSRIAFHVDFPDYSESELMDITKLMMKNKGMTLSDDAEQKLAKIFSEAVKLHDFGNGRFVRNLLEQAVMNLANRLSDMSSSVISDKELTTLVADDFEMPKLCANKKTVNRIGF